MNNNHHHRNIASYFIDLIETRKRDDNSHRQQLQTALCLAMMTRRSVENVQVVPGKTSPTAIIAFTQKPE